MSHFLEKLGKLFEGFSSIMQFFDIELYSPSFHYSSTYPFAFFHPSCKFYSCLPMGMGPFHYIFIHYVTSLTIFLGKWGPFSYFPQVCNFPQGSSPTCLLREVSCFSSIVQIPQIPPMEVWLSSSYSKLFSKFSCIVQIPHMPFEEAWPKSLDWERGRILRFLFIWNVPQMFCFFEKVWLNSSNLKMFIIVFIHCATPLNGFQWKCVGDHNMPILGNYASSLNASFKKLYGFYFPPLHKFPVCFLSSHGDENYHNQRISNVHKS